MKLAYTLSAFTTLALLAAAAPLGSAALIPECQGDAIHGMDCGPVPVAMPSVSYCLPPDSVIDCFQASFFCYEYYIYFQARSPPTLDLYIGGSSACPLVP